METTESKEDFKMHQSVNRESNFDRWEEVNSLTVYPTFNTMRGEKHKPQA